MKKLLQSLLFLLTFSVTSSFASSGIFDGYAVVNSTYYDLITATANPDFQGANLGIFNAGTGFTLGGQIKTFKNGADNICAGRLKYSIFLSTGSPGVFSTVNLPFDTNLVNPGDQQWTTAPGGIVANGLAPGNYKIAVWVADQGDGAGGCTLDPFHTSDNGGSYWIATFTVIPNPITPITVVSTGGTLLATYATVAAAVTAINVGTHTGTITCYIPAGYTETAPAGGYALTATGTAPNPITFIKSGAGANPVFTAFLGQTSGNLNDAVFKLLGSDYVTFDGLTLQENVANTTTASATNNMTEFGFALLQGSATNGCQNNTIQNCTISLNRLYSNTFGIYSNTRHTATAPTATADITSATGSNSNNKIYANAISNVDYGIVFVGSGSATAGLQDSGNDVGGSNSATGNTITNWGGLVSGAISGFISVTGSNAGIYMNHQTSDNVTFNTLVSATNITTLTTQGFLGIFKAYTSTQPVGTTFTSNYNSNTVTLTNSGATTSQMAGISLQGLTTLATATLNCNNNSIINCAHAGAGVLAAPMLGIFTASAPGTLNINGNIVRGFTTTTTTTGAFVGIQQQTNGVVNTLNINNNKIGDSIAGAVNFNNTTTTAGVTGIAVTSAGASATCALSINGNDFRGVTYTTSGTGVHTYITNASTTLSQNISNNTFTNLNVNTTGNVTFIANSVSAPAAGFKTINNNSIVTAFNKGGAGGTVSLYADGGSSVATAGIQNNNNNFSNITVTGATTITGWFNNDGTGSTPIKQITGNTFSNWTCGTSPVTALQSNFGGNLNLSSNTVSNISSLGAITGISQGSSGTIVTSNVSNNSVSNLSGVGTVIAISNASPATTATNINNNTINGLSTSGASQVLGVSSTATNGTIFKNRIFDLSGTNASSTLSGINISAGTTVNAYNNFISDIRNSVALGAVPIYGVNVSGGTNVGLYNNTIALGNSSPLSGSATQFGVTGIGYSSTTNTTLRNNIVWIDATPTGTGTVAAVRRSGAGTAGTAPTSTSFIANNNIYFINAPGINKYLYLEGTVAGSVKNGYGTAIGIADDATNNLINDPTFNLPCSKYKVFMGAGRESVTYNENNLTPGGTTGTFAPSGTSYAENGAAAIASPSITDDFAGIVRTPTNDIGALQFSGTAIAAPATVSVTATATTICAGSSSTLTASSSNLTYTYVWSPSTGLSATTGASVIASPTITTTYTVSSTDGGGFCGPSTSITIIVNPAPTGVTATATTTNLCEGSTINLTSNFTAASLGVGMAKYLPTRTTVTAYTSIIPATSITTWRNGTNTDDNLSDNQSVGFPFVYNGVSYTTFRVSTNGFLTFDNASAAIGSGSGAYGWSNNWTTAASGLIVAPNWDDLQTAGNLNTLLDLNNSINYITTGLSPNRVLTVEWKNMQDFNATSTASYNWQVKLYEVNGKIDLVYGTMTQSATPGTLSSSTGISAATVSATPTATELLCQTTENSNSFGFTNQNSLANIPASNTTISFVPATPVYSWTGPNSFTSSIANPTIAAATPAASGIYNLVISNPVSGCPSATASTATVTVSSLAVGGTVTGTTTWCYNKKPSDLTVSGFTGTVQKWQYDTTNAFTTPTDIASTAITLPQSLAQPATGTLYYRAIIVNGVYCPTVPSTSILVKPIAGGNLATYTAGAWVPSAPSASTTSIIFNDNYAPSAAVSLVGCDCTVKNGFVVDIPSGSTVDLLNELTVENAAGTLMIFENNAALIQTYSTYANSGNVQLNRNSSSLMRLDYTLWSSPLLGSQTLKAFSPLTVNNRFYTYTTATNTYSTIDPNANTFFAGKGFLIRMPDNHPTTPTIWSNGKFLGTPYNGTIPVTISTAGTGFNVIGNPYPSPIDINQFLSDNSTKIESSLYFWRKTNESSPGPILSSGYCTLTGGILTQGSSFTNGVNPLGILQTGQAFMVQAKAGQSTVTFNNGARIFDTANQFFKTTSTPEVKNTFWLNLKTSTGDYAQMASSYREIATMGVDINDGLNLNDGQISVGSYVNNKNYVIQSRTLPFDVNDVMPLVFKTNIDGNYTFAIDHVDGLFTAGAQAIYLRDNVLNTVTNLNTGNYTFATTAGTIANRFEIIYQNVLATPSNSLNEDALVVYKNNGDIVVNSGNVVIENVKIFDMRGRLLLDKSSSNTSEVRLNIGTTNQVVLVKTTLSEGQVITKKIIN